MDLFFLFSFNGYLLPLAPLHIRVSLDEKEGRGSMICVEGLVQWEIMIRDIALEDRAVCLHTLPIYMYMCTNTTSS